MNHLTALKIINFVIGAFTVLIGGLFLALFVLPGLWVWWEQDELPGLVFVVVGLLSFLLLVGVGAAHVAVGYLVGSGRGRILQTLLATTQIMSFPIGTAYALYALYVCWADEASVKKFESAIKPPVT